MKTGLPDIGRGSGSLNILILKQTQKLAVFKGIFHASIDNVAKLSVIFNLIHQLKLGQRIL